jgi:rhodanese-related sulfurtransferase
MWDIDIETFAAASRRQGADVLDVREPMEFVRGHVPGARPLPMSQFGARLGELDRSRPVYLICASGNRSGAMTDLLRARGYDAWNVAGGTAAWVRSGRALDTGMPSRAA